MPIYEYRCERGHTFEVMQRMVDDPLTVCEEHGSPVQRVFHPVAVHFKGSGFYNTDYGKKKSGAAGAASEGGSSSDGSSSEGSSSKSDSDSSSGSSDSKKKDSSSTKSSSSSD
jgi:putative FmdB family regulatory protein